MSFPRSPSIVVFAVGILLGCQTSGLRASPPKVAERWALLIGVDDYANATALRYCGADQRGLRARLVKAGFAEDHVFLMHDGAEESRYRPSQRNIEKQLDLVLSLASEDAMVVVAFSGHGVSLEGKSYLCPNDATLDDPDTLVSLDALYERLQRCDAAFKLLLVDACRNDPRRGGQRTFSATKGSEALARSLQESRLPDGVVLLNSCAPGEISYEEPELGHGVFMHYVLEGLVGPADVNDDGAVSLNELQRYAGGKTKAHVARKFNDSQRPFFRGDLSSEALEYALLPVSPGGLPHDSAAIQALIDEALAAARMIPDAKERSFPLRSIGSLQARMGDQRAAKETILESLDAARATKEEDRRSALSWTAEAFHEAGDSAMARQIVTEALAVARRANLSYLDISWVAETAVEIGNSAAAVAMFDEAKAVARQAGIPGSALASVAREQAEAGMEAAGRATLEEALRRGGYGSNEFAAKFFCGLARWHARRGDLKAAYEAARSAGDLTLREAQQAFGEVAEAQAKQGDLTGALATARWLTDDLYRSSAILHVVRAKAERGDIGAAQALITEIGRGWARDSAVAAVGKAQLMQGDSQAALQSVRSISKASYRLDILTRVAFAFEKQGNPAAKGLFDEVLLSMQSLPLDEYDTALHGVAWVFAEFGRVERGIEMARGARTAEAKASALRSMAEILYQQNKKAAESRPAPETDGE